MSKGSKRRPGDDATFASNYDRVFSEPLRPEGDAVSLPAPASTTYEAIVWLGTHGSWSQAGHSTPEAARDAAQRQIDSKVWGSRTDLAIEVQDCNGNRVEAP